jgi:putative addiction module component (TIGR02574 family)
MGKLKDKNLNELLKRSLAEKIHVVEKLWDNIKESSKVEKATLTEKVLIEERLAEYKANPNKVKKWEDLKASYLKKK